MANPVTVLKLQEKKERGEKIVALTAYDYATAILIDRAAVDIILVGDSLSMVVLGLESTRPVSMDAMIHHTAAVRRATTRALLLGDMPHEAYHGSPKDAVKNAKRFFEEGGVDAIKLEGGRAMAPVVEAVIDAEMPLMGHVGLLPQSMESAADFKVQGKVAEDAEQILEDAQYLEAAGAFAVVLECIPHQLAALISQTLTIPTIGIGAGPGCDGQVQVIHDIIGMVDGFQPKHAKKYMDLAAQVQAAVEEYRDEVVGNLFPLEEHSFRMKADEWESLRKKHRG